MITLTSQEQHVETIRGWIEKIIGGIAGMVAFSSLIISKIFNKTTNDKTRQVSSSISIAVMMYLLKGNILAVLQTVKQHAKKKYQTDKGIFLVNIPEQNLLVITDTSIRNMLLKNYSEKLSRNPSIATIVGWPSSLSTESYSKIWKVLRLETEKSIGNLALPQYEDMIQKIAAETLLTITTKTVNPFTVARTFTMNVMCTMIIGEENLTVEIKKLQEGLIECINIIEEQGPSFLVNPVSRIADEKKRQQKMQKLYPKLTKAFNTIDTIIKKLIELERGKTKRSNSIIGNLVQLLDTVNTDVQQELQTEVGNPKFTTIELADYIIKAQVQTILLAGSSTSASTMGWLLYLLAENPQAQEKVYSEIKEFLQSRNVQKIDTLVEKSYKKGNQEKKTLHYLQAAVMETLLHYNPAAIVMRVAKEDFDVNGYSVKKGNLLIMDSHFSAQEILNNKEEKLHFYPERFISGLTEEEDNAYKPFGFGKTLCSGADLGMKQTVLFMITIVKHNIKMKKIRDIVPSGEVTMNPKKPALMEFQKM